MWEGQEWVQGDCWTAMRGLGENGWWLRAEKTGFRYVLEAEPIVLADRLWRIRERKKKSCFFALATVQVLLSFSEKVKTILSVWVLGDEGIACFFLGNTKFEMSVRQASRYFKKLVGDRRKSGAQRRLLSWGEKFESSEKSLYIKSSLKVLGNRDFKWNNISGNQFTMG